MKIERKEPKKRDVRVDPTIQKAERREAMWGNHKVLKRETRNVLNLKNRFRP